MNLIVNPGPPIRGEAGRGSPLPLPGDKSISHRAILLAALAEGESHLENLLVAGVTRPLLEALRALGVDWELDGTHLTIQGCGLHGFHPPAVPLDCGNSGTALRLLTGALAAAGVPATLDGTPGLRRRPMNRIVEPLRAMGVPIDTAEGGTAPLQLSARPASQPLHAINYTLPVASAQIKSCLLLAALAADGPTTLHEPGPSRDHTERMLSSMGVRVEVQDMTVRLHPPAGSLKPLHLEIPGDFSAAAFLIVAALTTPGSSLTLRGVGLNPTRTGLLEALAAMGAEIRVSHRPERQGEPTGDLAVRYSSLRATQVEGERVVRMIDEFPIFAVAAACAQGTTVVRQAEELRFKESDRIAALCQELRALGVEARETPDGFTIAGGRQIHGGTVASHSDHRLAMSLAVAGLAAVIPVTVQGAEISGESFPDFDRLLHLLGAEIDSQP